ncbi:unnamed protein product [Phytomonas sp. EM1]|nr:unnamed protein product [Phytomonas sp. EM1]|eukprot:CCW61608.1 unnamed protein product [Phytomonas sp. isolate EM1]
MSLHSLDHNKTETEFALVSQKDYQATSKELDEDSRVLNGDINETFLLPLHENPSHCSPFLAIYRCALCAGNSIRRCLNILSSRVHHRNHLMNEIKPLDDDSANAFPDNTVSNTHYSIHTFLFLNLYEQFRRPLNFYFLLVAALQFIPSIAPVSPLSTLIPILFAFTLTAIKEGCDDVERYRHDCKYNARLRLVLDKFSGQWCYKKNASIRVGDVIMLQRNEDIPCDVVAIASSAPNIYIRTDNLDGEIDLKLREVVTPPMVVSSAANARVEANGGGGYFPDNPSRTRTTFISMDDSVSLLQQKLACLTLTYPPPNSTIDSFDGMAVFDLRKVSRAANDLLARGEESAVKFSDEVHSVSLSHSHLLPQFCLLKNTDRIIAVAVYTGNNTKCGMNKRKTPVKWARIDQDVNRYAMLIFLFQISVSIAFGAIAMHKNENLEQRVWYLPLQRDSMPSLFIVYTMRFFLLTSVMIPLSFKLVVDMSKYYMSKMVAWDKVMTHSGVGPNGDRDVGCSVKNSSILEDLGQVNYVLSDKTGTLTQNVMTLAHVTVAPDHQISLAHLDLPGDVCAAGRPGARLPVESPALGGPATVAGRAEVIRCASAMALCTSVEVVPVRRPVMEAAPARHSSSTSPSLSTCASPSVCRNPSAYPSVDRSHVLQFTYQAVSPDEVALCCGAAKLGVTLQRRTPHEAVLRVAGEDHRYRIHHVFPFSSDTRSMGIIVEHVVTERILLLVKGADEQVGSMLRHPLRETHPDMVKHLRVYAKSGLRVLLFAEREFTRTELDLFLFRQHQAELDLVERQLGIDAIRKEIMSDLIPSGITAIEDKLQENVQATIDMMLKAGIKVWMLTGDKMETSEQIALSCGLYKPHHRVIRIVESSDSNEDWVNNLISNDLIPVASPTYSSPISSAFKSAEVLIVQGERVLDRILSDKFLTERFERLASCCLSVVCVRMTPRQKAAICHFMRKRGHITLAVGDGGNDVSMLQEANVGVGILGKESAQAARAADFSIAQFDDLRSLVFFHGQLAYVCTAYLIKYSFYKSMLIAFTQLAYTAVFTRYSGKSFWTSFMLLMWNGVYTLPHTLLYCLDRCAPRVVLERFPSLYNLTRKGADLNFKELFCSYLFRGILQSVILLWLLTNVFDSSFVFAQGGETASSEIYFTAAYTSILLSQVIMIYTESHSVTILNLLVVFFLPVFYLIITFIDSEHSFDSHIGVFTRTLRPHYIIAVMAMTAALTMPWVVLMCLRDFMHLNRRNILRAEALSKCKQLLKCDDVYKTKLEIWLYRLLGFLPEPESLYLSESDNALLPKETEKAVDEDSYADSREKERTNYEEFGRILISPKAKVAPTI